MTALYHLNSTNVLKNSNVELFRNVSRNYFILFLSLVHVFSPFFFYCHTSSSLLFLFWFLVLLFRRPMVWVDTCDLPPFKNWISILVSIEHAHSPCIHTNMYNHDKKYLDERVKKTSIDNTWHKYAWRELNCPKLLAPYEKLCSLHIKNIKCFSA